MLELAVVLFAMLAGQAGGDTVCRDDLVELQTREGVVSFEVEVADEPEERAQGLMYRKHLAKDAGMLFIYEQPTHAVFWMKNTVIPLDMIFADQNGRVARVHHHAKPLDLTGIDGGQGIYVVLEINAGLSRKLGIVPGSRMRHPAFSAYSPLWPC